LQEDLVSDGVLVQRKDERLHKDVRFEPIQKLLNLPVRISPVISIYEADQDSDDFGDTIAVYVDELPTLYSLIQSLLTRNPRYGVSVPPSYEVVRLAPEDDETPMQEVLKAIFAPEMTKYWLILAALATFAIVVAPPLAAKYLLHWSSMRAITPS